MRELSAVRESSAAEQRKLEDIDARGRDGRTRFGFAVDALGLDASKARGEVRAARASLEQPRAGFDAARRTRYKEAQREVIAWEGRSGLEEPYAQLARAYRECAEAVDAWLAVRTRERAAQAAVEEKERTVTDLDYQIAELRAALANHEQGIDRDRERRTEAPRRAQRARRARRRRSSSSSPRASASRCARGPSSGRSSSSWSRRPPRRVSRLRFAHRGRCSPGARPAYMLAVPCAPWPGSSTPSPSSPLPAVAPPPRRPPAARSAGAARHAGERALRQGRLRRGATSAPGAEGDRADAAARRRASPFRRRSRRSSTRQIATPRTGSSMPAATPASSSRSSAQARRPRGGARRRRRLHDRASRARRGAARAASGPRTTRS